MQTVSQFIRERAGPPVFSPWELNQMARGLVEQVDTETGQRKAHGERVARLYNVLRDIQNAAEHGAKDVSVHQYVQVIAKVWANAFYVGVYRRVMR